MQKGVDGDGVYRKVLMVVVVCAERKESVGVACRKKNEVMLMMVVVVCAERNDVGGGEVCRRKRED